jgi:hypothetical protein
MDLIGYPEQAINNTWLNHSNSTWLNHRYADLIGYPEQCSTEPGSATDIVSD